MRTWDVKRWLLSHRWVAFAFYERDTLQPDGTVKPGDRYEEWSMRCERHG